MYNIKLFTLLYSLLWLTGCHSQPAQEISLYNPHPEINANNLVDSVMAHIQLYPQEPMYYIFAHNSQCYYEILVNDLPVYQSFRQGTVATPIFLNMGITQSGEQTLTYRLHPYDQVFDSYANFGFRIGSMDNRIDFKSKQEMPEHRAPYRVEMRGSAADIPVEVFEGQGKSYFEHTITFQAQVPYHIKGWTEGQDLRKLDQDTLYAAVMNYYKNYKKIYENEDADLLAGLIYESLIETIQENYEDRSKMQEMWEVKTNTLKIKEKNYFSMENVSMKYYGNGRVVALHLVTDDISLTNWSALSFKYKSGKNVRARSLDLYLYLPKGEKDLRKFKKAF